MHDAHEVGGSTPSTPTHPPILSRGFPPCRITTVRPKQVQRARSKLTPRVWASKTTRPARPSWRQRSGGRRGGRRCASYAPSQRQAGSLRALPNAGGNGQEFRLLRSLRVADGCVGQPYGPLLRVRAVPHPAGASHFVLPLLEPLAAHLTVRQPCLVRVLSLVHPKGIGSQPSPAFVGGPASMAPELLPTVGGVTGGEHHVPLPAGRWGSDPLTSLWGRPLRRRHRAVTRLPNGFLIGLVSRSASSGSAKIAAVSRHCVK